MEAKDVLLKQIITECVALVILIFCILYAFFALGKGDKDQISTVGDFVVVLNKSNVSDMINCSDGVGLENDGLTYIVTNNGGIAKNYKIVIVPKKTKKNVLDYVRVGVNDVAVSNLTDLEEEYGGYVVDSYALKAGYTKKYSIKYWYKINADQNIVDNKVDFDVKLVVT